MKPLRAIDIEILRELRFATRYEKWVAPIDIGGTNGSCHSYVLSKLCKRGLAERKRRMVGFSRGSYVYRATNRQGGE